MRTIDAAAGDDDADVMLRAGAGSSSTPGWSKQRSAIAQLSGNCVTTGDHRSLHRSSIVDAAIRDRSRIRPHLWFHHLPQQFHHHLRIPDPPPNSALGGPNTIKNNKMKNISNGVVIPRGVNGCRRCRRARMLWYEWFAGGPTVVRDCARILG